MSRALSFGRLPRRLIVVALFLLSLTNRNVAHAGEETSANVRNSCADERTRVVVTVRDAARKSPLGCRVYLKGNDGNHYFAKSTSTEGSALTYNVERSPTTLEKHTTVSAHPFEFDVPQGIQFTLSVERGKEYVPHVQEFLSDVKELQLEVALRRWVDMPARGWYSGDTHVHRKLEDCPNLVEAEDLHVAFPLTYWVRDAYLPADRGPQAEGVKPELIRVGENRFLWPVNTEYELFTVNGKAHTQGAVFVLNHKRPLSLAAPPVAPIAHEAHETGALLDLDKHSWNWTVMIVPLMQADLFELANNHVWRTNFLFRKWTIEMTPTDWGLKIGPEGVDEEGWIDWGFQTYYAFLNCGFRLRPTGGTGSGVHPVPLGFGRVYVHVDGELTYEKWVAGLNAGHSFVTTGPMLLAEFNGQRPGTVFKNVAGADRTVRLKGTAESRSKIERLEVIVNGEVARSIEPTNKRLGSDAYVTAFDVEIPLDHSAWVAVRCHERDAEGRMRYAHTAPVHLEIDGPVRPRRREVNHFIERMQHEIARNRGVLADSEVAEYERALAIYQEIAKRARD